MTDWIAFLQQQGGQPAVDQAPAAAVIASFGERPADYPTLLSTTLLIPLDDRGVIRVSGADTDKLLQGQLTCDLSTIAPNQAGNGALCTVQGRTIGNFPIARDGAGDTLLLPPAALVPAILETLKKYAVFYKTQLSDDSARYQVLGLAGPDASQVLAATSGSIPSGSCHHYQDMTFIQLGAQRWLAVVPDSSARQLWQQLAGRATPAGLPLWELLTIRDGQGEVRPATREEFIPQMLNLQHTGGISFRKGCYTGQEIVARMQYLGKLKRRMYRLAVAATVPPVPGTKIQRGEGGPNCGHVVLAARADQQNLELLAVLTAEAAAGQQLLIDGQLYAVDVLPLPYEHQFTSATDGD